MLWWKRKVPYAKEIKRVFKAGSIYHEVTRGHGDDERKIKMFPQITKVEEIRGALQIEFEIPFCSE